MLHSAKHCSGKYRVLKTNCRRRPDTHTQMTTETTTTSTGRDPLSSVFWDYDPMTVKLKLREAELTSALLAMDSQLKRLENADNKRLARKTADASKAARFQVLHKLGLR